MIFVSIAGDFLESHWVINHVVGLVRVDKYLLTLLRKSRRTSPVTTNVIMNSPVDNQVQSVRETVQISLFYQDIQLGMSCIEHMTDFVSLGAKALVIGLQTHVSIESLGTKW